MAKCSDNERAALNDAGPLLRFAAEHVKKLDPDLSLAIAEARAAVATDHWAPQISQRFWSAYNQLCALVDPVTMDGLSVAEGKVEQHKWSAISAATEEVPFATRSANRYFVFLIALRRLICSCNCTYGHAQACRNRSMSSLRRTSRSSCSSTDDYAKLSAATAASAAKSTVDEIAKAGKISRRRRQLESGRRTHQIRGENAR